jgi:putative ABC transport system substrate-binding protein
MRVIGLAVVLIVGLTLAPLAGETQQQTEKVYRIGVLSPESPPPGLLNEFEQELRKLGYIRGKNVAIELRHAEGKSERLAALADELVRLRVDVILAVNTSAVQAAKKATTTIPIVMTRVADPVRIGLVSSISRPGGNVTGLSFILEELSIKRLQLLKEAIPTISRVAALWYTGNPGGAGLAKEMEGASAQLGLRFLRLPVQGPGDFPGAFEAANRDRAEALLLIDDAVITRHRDAILNLAAKHKLPVTSQYKPFAEGGA